MSAIFERPIIYRFIIGRTSTQTEAPVHHALKISVSNSLILKRVATTSTTLEQPVLLAETAGGVGVSPAHPVTIEPSYTAVPPKHAAKEESIGYHWNCRVSPTLYMYIGPMV
jgi:hypothetical protein